MSKRKPAAAVMAPEVTHWSYMGLSMTDDPDTRYWPVSYTHLTLPTKA